MASVPVLAFFQVVKLCDASEHFAEVGATAGTVIGRVYDEASERWWYAVQFDGIAELYQVLESDLHPTAEFRRQSEYYDGAHMRVIVDPRSGEGQVANE